MKVRNLIFLKNTHSKNEKSLRSQDINFGAAANWRTDIFHLYMISLIHDGFLDFTVDPKISLIYDGFESLQSLSLIYDVIYK